MPVPAGIDPPVMTFSFRPYQFIGLALDGGVGQDPGRFLEGKRPREGNGQLLSDALVIPKRIGRPTAGRLPSLKAFCFPLELVPRDYFGAGKQFGIAFGHDGDAS